jgi:hypothetical protein
MLPFKVTVSPFSDSHLPKSGTEGVITGNVVKPLTPEAKEKISNNGKDKRTKELYFFSFE